MLYLRFILYILLTLLDVMWLYTLNLEIITLFARYINNSRNVKLRKWRSTGSSTSASIFNWSISRFYCVNVKWKNFLTISNRFRLFFLCNCHILGGICAWYFPSFCQLLWKACQCQNNKCSLTRSATEGHCSKEKSA